MTKTTIFNPLLEEKFQQLTTPNYQVFATVAAARLGTYTSALADSPVCYIEEKEAFYNWCNDCGLPDDGDLVLTTASGGTSRWELVQKVSRTQGDAGWIDKNGLTISKLNTTTLRVSTSSNAYYAVKSKRVTLPPGNYDISFTGAARRIVVYFNESGTLSQTDTVEEIFSLTPVAMVYWTGTVIGGIQTEFHGIRDIVWHAWAHKYLGTQYDSGLSITTNTQPDNNNDPGADDTVQYLWLTTGTIYDEDTPVTVGTGNWLQTLGSGLTSATAAVIPFFYYNGVAVIGAAANANREPFLFTGANGFPQRNNGGVLTAGTNGEYIVYHYFASPFIDGYSVFARPHNNTVAFTTLIAAQAARPSSLVWSAIGEWKHIYSVVFRCGNWGNTPTHNCKIVSVQDFRLVSSGPATGTNASAHGALSGLSDPGAHPASAIAPDTTNFNGELSPTESSVQLVVDRLDDYDSLLDWVASTATYRVGNVVRVTATGFIGEWRCVTAHIAAAAFSTDVESGYWEIVANSEGSRELVTQSAHGFASGDVLYSNAGTYTKAKADAFLTSEVVGIVVGATTNKFVLAKTGKMTKSAWGLTAGTTYYLSAATAGLIISTEPNTNYSVRLGVADTANSLQLNIGRSITEASATLKGLVTTTTQTFAGDKTFAGTTIIGATLTSNVNHISNGNFIIQGKQTAADWSVVNTLVSNDTDRTPFFYSSIYTDNTPTLPRITYAMNSSGSYWALGTLKDEFHLGYTSLAGYQKGQITTSYLKISATGVVTAGASTANVTHIVNGAIGLGGTTAPTSATNISARAVTLADDAVLNLTSGVHILEIMDNTSAEVVASFFLRGGVNSVTKITDPLSMADNSDTDGKLCVYYSSGYKLKNRLGTQRTFSVFIRGDVVI